MLIHVRGDGFNNKRRIVRQQVKTDWKCDMCGARNRYYWLRCPNCRNPRPEA